VSSSARTLVSRVAILVSCAAAAGIAAGGCGKSPDQECADKRDAACPAGQVNSYRHESPSACVTDLSGDCSGEYEDLVVCLTATPNCDKMNADGSSVSVGAIHCSAENKAHMACLCKTEGLCL